MLRSFRPIDLASYEEIVVLTGAGISVASGLPTYRGVGGLWDEIDVEAHATSAALAEDPARVWRFFAEMRAQIGRAMPNPAHHALATAERRLRADQRLTVITQNIDGLHLTAGSQRVVELHGAIGRSRCGVCDSVRDVPGDDADGTCPTCGGLLRPDVVLFGEPMPAKAEWEAKKALRDCDLFIAVGTSGCVSPASNFVRGAAYAGARTIYVNLEPMEPFNPAFQEVVLGRAEVVLPEMLAF
jgi:NAD-dependent deacetylase